MASARWTKRLRRLNKHPSHNLLGTRLTKLKSLAESHGVSVVFEYDFKLNRLTSFLGHKQGSQINHKDAPTICEVAVVIEMHMACGFSLVSQTVRCLNHRTSEHKRAVDTYSANSEIAKYLSDCSNCLPDRK